MRGPLCQRTRFALGAIALVMLATAGLPSTTAEARARFDLGVPTYVAPPLYYGYARPASYSSYSPTPAVAGPVGFGGYHWQ
jgi:hypothetical protein